MNLSIERLEQIELERSKVAADPAFQAWMKDLNLYQSYINPEPKHRAKEMMALWTGTKGELNSFVSILNKVVDMEISSYL